MHTLCHALNTVGAEAYLFPVHSSPHLRTPLLNQEVLESHAKAGLEPIVVYPEVVSGNPFNARSVVRYVLNHRGLFGGDMVYPASDLVFCFSRIYLKPEDDPENILFLPQIDTSVFHNQHNAFDPKRSGVLIYPGRYASAASAYPEIFQNATIITKGWPSSHQELADLFRRSEMLYCFESTAVVAEAGLCGCPSVILPSPLVDIENVRNAETGHFGIAFGDSMEEIQFAKATVHRVAEDFANWEATFWQQLNRFVALTQAMPVQPVANTQLASSAQAAATRLYAAWTSRQSVQEVDAQLLAERMIGTWSYTPQLHLLLELNPGEESGLADTLDSLSTQLYGGWLLTVIASQPAPDGVAEQPKLQWLELKDAAHSSFVLNEMAVHSPCQWVSRITPGLTFAPHALLVIADQINCHPSWALVYTDEDTLEPDGNHSQPCFKPGPDLFMLRSQSFTGSFVTFRKDAFLAAGGFGSHSGAEVYDLTLRIADSVGQQALGHIEAMLVHLARTSPRSSDMAAEAAVVQGHLQRQHVNATVNEGAFFGVRNLAPHLSAMPPVSILIESDGVPDKAITTAQQLLATTDYPDFEILVTESSGHQMFLQLLYVGLEEQSDHRLRIVDTSAAQSKTDRVRRMLLVARGSLVFFMSTPAAPKHPAWLTEMVRVTAWPDVGAVQASLVNAQTGQLVCPGYAPALLFSPVGLAPETIHTIPTQQRALAAVDERALLVSKVALTAFLTDSIDDAPTFWALALARHLQEHGLHMVWKPEVQMHLTGDGNQRATLGVYEGLGTCNTATDSDLAFLEAHLTWLASSHLYNGQLSYSKPCQFNLDRLVDWDIHQGDRPKILVLGQQDCSLPAESQYNVSELAHHALCQVSHWTLEVDADPWIALMEIARSKPDILLFGHIVHPNGAALMRLVAKYLPHVTRVFCIDDCSETLMTSGHANAELVALICTIAPTLAFADKVVVTSDGAFDALRTYHPNVRKTMTLMTWPEIEDRRSLETEAKPRIGLLMPENHPETLPLLQALAQRFENHAIFICFEQTPNSLNNPRVVHIQHPQHAVVSPEGMKLCQLDLVLLPRARRFSSELTSPWSALNAIAAGCACISSPVAGFEKSPLLMPELDVHDWTQAVRGLLASREARLNYAKESQVWASAQFATQEGLESVSSAYLT